MDNKKYYFRLIKSYKDITVTIEYDTGEINNHLDKVNDNYFLESKTAYDIASIFNSEGFKEISQENIRKAIIKLKGE